MTRPSGGRLRGRALGAAGAACAVCCAAPVASLLGIGLTGAATTALALALAGIVFAVVVAGATGTALIVRRRRARRDACSPSAGPVPVELGLRPDGP